MRFTTVALTAIDLADPACADAFDTALAINLDQRNEWPLIDGRIHQLGEDLFHSDRSRQMR